MVGGCDAAENGLLPGVQHEALAAAVQPIVRRLNRCSDNEA